MSDIIHSWDEAKDILGKRKSRKLANNTYLEYVTEDEIAIRLHETRIITFIWNAPIVLNSGGWRTVTTKERMNRFSPARIYTERGIWYIYGHGDGNTWGGTRYPYRDGIQIDSTGTPIDVEPDNGSDAKLKNKLDRIVRKYIDRYCAHLVAEAATNKTITIPGTGDCWGCYFQTGDDPITQPLGFDHYLAHFEEQYFVPSLLWRALQNRGNPSVCWHMIEYQALAGDTRMARESLQSFFKRIKPNLFEEYKRHVNR